MGVVNNLEVNNVVNFGDITDISLLLCKIIAGIFEDCVGIGDFFDISLNFDRVDYCINF